MRCVKKFSLALLLLLTPLLVVTSSNADEPVKWTRVNTPADGKAGNWVLASGSDVQYLTLAGDGALYAYCKGLTYTLYKSTDRGVTWAYIGNVKDAIVDIAVAPDNPSVIYYGTTSTVYKSKDGGATFDALPIPGGAGSGNIEITALNVARGAAGYLIAVATRDTDAHEFGGVYFLDESEAVLRWQNTAIGNYDAYQLRFSPAYANDRSIISVVTDETDTLVVFKSGNGGWGAISGNAKLNKDNTNPPSSVSVTGSASIAFSDGWNALDPSPLFVGIDSGNGDVYKITPVQASSSTAVDLNVASISGINNIDVTSIVTSGSGSGLRLLAGAAASSHVYSSSDAGKSWAKDTKEPTGASKTYLVLSPDFARSNIAYAATSGAESAFSVTATGGDVWNQTSLIDSTISSIKDLAVSPDYAHDGTIFMLTFGGKTSLWRSRNGGVAWEIIFSNALPYLDQMTMIELSPQYPTSKTVYLTGTKGANSIVARSTDSGQTFRNQFAVDPKSKAAISIDTLTVADDNTIFLGSFSGTSAVVYQSKDGGFIYSPAVEAGANVLVSLVLSPTYPQDRTILASNNSGWVFLSKDSGTSFDSVPLSATAPLTGLITVAFDANYADNHAIYAASNTADKGISRFVIGTSTKWEPIDSSYAAGGKFNPLLVSADGVLYAVNTKAGTGIERSLNPAYALGPTFETVTRGLDTGVTVNGLWFSGSQLWSVDVTNTKLMTFADTEGRPLILNVPANKAIGLGRTSGTTVKGVTLDWQTVPGATSYTWQLSPTGSFTSIPTGFTDDTDATSAGNLPALDAGATYYWRVRANSPVLGQWSDKWSFTTTLGSGSSAPKINYPDGSATGLSAMPVFQWNAVDGATNYELLVSADSAFGNIAIDKTGKNMLSSTTWKADTKLNYTTTYFWKVRAIGDKTTSAWSSIGAFITEAAPVPSPSSIVPSSVVSSPSPLSVREPIAPSPPIVTVTAQAPVSQSTPLFPGWMMYLFGGVLVSMAAVGVTVVILLIRKMKKDG